MFMIAFAANFLPLLMINYLIFIGKSPIEWIAYSFLEIYILYMINYG